MIDDVYELPKPVWDAASRVFAANAKGEVKAFLREPSPTSIWNTVEKPTMNFMNKLNAAFTGTPATVVKNF
jgi:hypothetical protein